MAWHPPPTPDGTSGMLLGCFELQVQSMNDTCFLQSGRSAAAEVLQPMPSVKDPAHRGCQAGARFRHVAELG